MSMECAEARRIAAAWERGDAVATAALREARVHGATCGDCAETLAVFLALGGRDEAQGARGRPSPEAKALADRVMAGIDAFGPAAPMRPVRFPSSGAKRIAAIAALAACALIVVGFIGRDAGTVEVRFVLEAPGAQSVYLAGDFSEWDTKGLALKKTPSGLWERTVRLRRGMIYSYNFLVDGTSWVVDPAAPERIEDGFGGESALLRL